MLDARQTIEVFHLLFLRALGARVDKSLFSLKGGCNLRFFLRSIRYSEDMDLDIQTMAVGTLRNNVNRLLVEPTFVHGLRTHGIELLKIAEPKQTETTQRWKLILRNTFSRADTPTKIEFSRRGLDDERAIDPVDAAIIREYRLYPVIVQHYTASAAFTQKVLALALREQVQSRDVFDLKLLIDAGGAANPLPASAAARLDAAIENAMAVDYDAFAGQVLAYLQPEYQQHYRDKGVWAALQNEVVNSLWALRP